MSIGTPVVPSSLGALVVASGTQSFLNITAPTLVKTTGGRIMKISVLVAGTADGAVYDQDVITPDDTKKIANIPMGADLYTADFPCQKGILVVPPTGATIAVSFC
jgi:hypothetical protein